MQRLMEQQTNLDLTSQNQLSAFYFVLETFLLQYPHVYLHLQHFTGTLI